MKVIVSLEWPVSLLQGCLTITSWSYLNGTRVRVGERVWQYSETINSPCNLSMLKQIIDNVDVQHYFFLLLRLVNYENNFYKNIILDCLISAVPVTSFAWYFLKVVLRSLFVIPFLDKRYYSCTPVLNRPNAS